jgi:DNA-binding transcriptional regulator YdaS (Cro superfamily)
MEARAYFEQADGKLDRDGKELCRVAKLCGVKPYYLYMVAAGHKRPSAELAAVMEHATAAAINRRDVLPDFLWDAPPQAAA